MPDAPTLLAQAQAALDTSLAKLPEGKKGALAVVATTEGARVALVARAGEHWQVEAWGARAWESDDLDAGARVVFTW